MNVVVIGDSISYGDGLEDRSKAWPALLGFRNESVCGDTTRLMLERFPSSVQESGADVCIIQVGHNDANRWDTDRGLPRVSLGAFRANLLEMIGRCRAFDITPKLCMITPMVRKRPPWDFDINRYNGEIFAVAESTATPVYRVAHLFLAGEPSSFLLDGLHLNEAGHRLYADVVYASIVKAAL